MKRIFITRDLAVDSVFKTRLEAVGFEVHGESLIQFDPVPFTEVPPTDWIFFYSKNAVRFYFDGLQRPDFWKNKQLRQGPPKTNLVKYAAYGSATAAYLHKHHQIQAQFVGSAKPKRTAEALTVMAAGQRILFPCAKQSRHSLYKYIRYKTDAQKLVVYDNYIKTDFSIPKSDILVFTSPLNTKAYFQKYKLDKKQKIIAIGRTTSMALKREGVPKLSIAKFPSEQALADLIVESSDV